MEKKYTVELTLEEIGELDEGQRKLRIAALRALRGLPLEELPWGEWIQHWPEIDADLTLTGETVESDSPGRYYNYDDEAMISREAAQEGGWELDSPSEGYAQPAA